MKSFDVRRVSPKWLSSNIAYVIFDCLVFEVGGRVLLVEHVGFGKVEAPFNDTHIHIGCPTFGPSRVTTRG